MTILDLKRQEVASLIESGGMKKKSLLHYDICSEIKNGNTQNRISEKFDISSRQIRKIKRAKCPDCGILQGYRHIGTK